MWQFSSALLLNLWMFIVSFLLIFVPQLAQLWKSYRCWSWGSWQRGKDYSYLCKGRWHGSPTRIWRKWSQAWRKAVCIPVLLLYLFSFCLLFDQEFGFKVNLEVEVPSISPYGLVFDRFLRFCCSWTCMLCWTFGCILVLSNFFVVDRFTLAWSIHGYLWCVKKFFFIVWYCIISCLLRPWKLVLMVLISSWVGLD